VSRIPHAVQRETLRRRCGIAKTRAVAIPVLRRTTPPRYALRRAQDTAEIQRVIMLDRLKNLLRAPEQKTSRTATVISLDGGGRARWTARDYAALAREGYVKNAIVYRAVKLVAESVGSLTFLLYEGAQERDRHPLLDLIAKPNPRQDGAAFLEARHASAARRQRLCRGSGARRPRGARRA
jgi:hypothetical protein